MTSRFIKKFESGLAKLAAGLRTPRGDKKRGSLLQKIERLQEKSHGIGQHYRIEVLADPTDDKIAAGLAWEQVPVSGTQLTHPGVYCLRTNELNWDEATLWQTYTMLTDLEAVFRSLKSELGLRPVFHHKEERADGHLFISVLAYQAIQALRQQLKAPGIKESWKTLRVILAGQHRITATFKQRDGRILHVRKTTAAEPKQRMLYQALSLGVTGGLTEIGGVMNKIHECSATTNFYRK